MLVGLFTTQAPALAAPTDFTIGIPGKTGCLVCHGDPKLTQVKAKRSLYISDTELMSSVHKDLACVKCHTDFSTRNASQSHQGPKTDSRKIAGLSCKNCHEHESQLKIYDTSVHGRKALGGDPKAATCADCHGSHAIKSLKKNKAYAAKFRMNAKEICGKCHQKYFESYDDYYHGRAYKMKAP
ncbi:MAG: multiheme c-type cytochrome, partial [Actinomycetota bacterium]